MKLWEALEHSNLGKASNKSIDLDATYDSVYAHDDGYYWGYDKIANKAVKLGLVSFKEANYSNWEPAKLIATTVLYKFLLRDTKNGQYRDSAFFYSTQATAREDVDDSYEVLNHIESTRLVVEV